MSTPTSAAPKTSALLNLPNQLTAARLGLGFGLFALIHLHYWSTCIGVLALVAFTDWLDGYVARLQNSGSAFGRNFDPLVDKVVVGGAYIFLLPVDGAGLEPWMVTLVVMREMAVTSLRSFLESKGASFGAALLGKIKMVLQIAALFCIFLALSSTSSSTLAGVRDGCIYAMLFAAVFSGAHYGWCALVILRKGDE